VSATETGSFSLLVRLLSVCSLIMPRSLCALTTVWLAADYLQGGDPDPVAGGQESPPQDWWPLLTELRQLGEGDPL
jgi:hypothetical protein